MTMELSKRQQHKAFTFHYLQMFHYWLCWLCFMCIICYSLLMNVSRFVWVDFKYNPNVHISPIWMPKYKYSYQIHISYSHYIPKYKYSYQIHTLLSLYLKANTPSWHVKWVKSLLLRLVSWYWKVDIQVSH